jgi:hypothetical protein
MSFPMSIPRLSFGDTQKKSKFHKIYMISGHGRQPIQDPRFKLKKNQYVMIPGKCGIDITADDDLYERFFNLKERGVNIYKNSTSKNITLNIKYKKHNILNTEENKVAELSQDFKAYYPGVMDTTSTNPPQILINPLMLTLMLIEGKQYLSFELSGILKSGNKVPLNFDDPGSPPMYRYQIEITDDTILDIPLGELMSSHPQLIADIMGTLRRSIEGSEITFSDILDLACLYKYGFYDIPFSKIPFHNVYNYFTKINNTDVYKNLHGSLTPRDLMTFEVPLQFFFDFLDSKQGDNDPYLCIVMTCRGVRRSKNIATPQRKEIIRKQRRGSIAGRQLFPLGRQNSLNTVNSTSMNNNIRANSPEPAGDGGGGWSPSVGFGALPHGGRRTQRRRVLRRTRRVLRRTRRVLPR